MGKYRWIASSNDGSFEDESSKMFAKKEECYNDMRNAALEKMKWNTEFNEDLDEADNYIGYEVKFSKDRIIHDSYSGVYTYEIKEVTEVRHIELTNSQIVTLKAAIFAAIDESAFRLERMTKEFSLDEDARQRITKSMERENVSRKQILELLEMIN